MNNHNTSPKNTKTIPFQDFKSKKLQKENILLKTKNQSLKLKIDVLLKNSLSNEKIFEGIHKITLGLSKCVTIQALSEFLKKNLKTYFKLDSFTKHSIVKKKLNSKKLFYNKEVNSPFFSPSELKQFENEFSPKKKHKSFAYINLKSEKIIGILGLASRKKWHFKEDQDAFFLLKLSEIIAASIERIVTTNEKD